MLFLILERKTFLIQLVAVFISGAYFGFFYIS